MSWIIILKVILFLIFIALLTFIPIIISFINQPKVIKEFGFWNFIEYGEDYNVKFSYAFIKAEILLVIILLIGKIAEWWFEF